MGAPRQKSSDAKFPNSLRIRCPSALPNAIDKAAAQNLMTASEYIRRSIIAQLRGDGIDPARIGVA